MHYKIEALVESDMDEGEFAWQVDSVLSRLHGSVMQDLSVYEVTH